MSDRDPLGYAPGDRVGIALDLDGTAYRSGATFVETLAFLPYELAADRSLDRHRRRALSAVGEYDGGDAGRRRWRRGLAVLDAVRRRGAPGLSERALSVAASAETDRDGDADRGDYRRMQREVLDAYGAILRGRRRERVEAAVERVVDDRLAVDRRLAELLGWTRERAVVGVVLVTDAPAHVAGPYARALDCGAEVVATDYRSAGGRFTGEYDRVDKARAVAELRADRDWEYVLAAGDTAVDLAMRPAADAFLAVDGTGRLDDHLDDPVEYDAPDPLGERLAPDDRTVRVRDRPLAPALRATLRAAGVL